MHFASARQQRLGRGGIHERLHFERKQHTVTRTYSPKAAEQKHDWLVIDATDVVLGRLATHAAALLLGKHKTTWQIVTLLYFLVLRASDELLFAWMQPLFHWPPTSPPVLGFLLVGISLVLTLWSGIAFSVKNRSFLTPE